jgi:N-acetylglucosaminyldiphosphoundecaprenol N-acetyl-beta-D-mannosaminyltransferase
MTVKIKTQNNYLFSRPASFEDYSSSTLKKPKYLDENIHDKMSYPSVNVMGYNVYSGKLNDIEFAEQKTVINTINAHSYVVARGDEGFKKALQSPDILIADGFPIVMAARWLKDKSIQKIAGEDIFFYLLNKLNYSSGSCFFLGSSEETLGKIKNRLTFEFPKIKAEFFSPPFRDKFKSEDNEVMIGRINQFKPDVLFIGMTAPKQEKWVLENYNHIDAKIICSIGAVFDFYSRNIKRPSKFWRFLRLEWFIRLVKEPRRLWRRYLVSSPIFFKHLFLHKFGYKKNI